MSTNVAIGAPQYGAKKKNNSRLVDGDNIYRILPPMFDLAQEGIWAVYECLHWGFKGTKGMRPFRCIQKKDYKTKMIKVQCPECDQIAQYTASKEARKEALKKEGKSDKEIEEAVQPLSDWLFSHNLDKKWNVNALTADGKITRLVLPHKAYAALQLVINDLVSGKSNGGVPVDPIGVEGGVWFNFNRSGKGNQTLHTVTVVTETVVADVGGRKVNTQLIKPAPLTQEVLQRLGSEAHNLSQLGRTLTYEEINRLVTSGGDPEVVDAVFSTGEISNAAMPDADEPEPGATAKSTNVVVSTQPAPTTPAVVDPMAAMKAEMDRMKAELEAAKKANTPERIKTSDFVPPSMSAPVETSKTASAPAAETLSDDEFIKSFGFSVTK